MTLLGIHSLSKSFGTLTLFEDLSFAISQGDRIGLLGPNGSGKSTLLKMIAELESPDKGNISRRRDLRIGYASQFPEFPPLSLEEILLQDISKEDSTEQEVRARILLGKAQFTENHQNASTLSGGWKKRLDIIRALMNDPHLLLLDEPTNHLDLEGILWLEKFLQREKIAYIIVSHDRYFLENVSNKIIELNKCYPQGLFICDGNLTSFMDHKEAFLQGQSKREQGLASTVREEIEWLRKSPKARTTKSESRIQRANQLIDDLSEVKRRNQISKVDIDFSASERLTRKLLVAKNVTKSLGGTELFKGIDLTLSPESCIGVVGRNGTGKTTLLKVLAGMIPQDFGTIKQADDLRIVYFDQHREQIPGHVTLRRALSPVGDFVNYRGQSIHVNGWAKKFLFNPERMELPVEHLSGGERARILIAKLMLEPADILFLDEPTNDLDIPTLEVIEESLKEFPGAVVLITHDRCLMDRVCTQILGLGAGNEHQLFTDYSQWETAVASPSIKKTNTPKSEPAISKLEQPKKLTYKEKRELEGMEETILSTEAEIATLQKKLEDPSTQADAKNSLEYYQLLSNSQAHLEALYERWQILMDKS